MKRKEDGHQKYKSKNKNLKLLLNVSITISPESIIILFRGNFFFYFIIKILSLALFYEIPGTRVSLLADMNSSEISLPLFYQWAICFANFKCITCRFYNYILMNIALCILNSSIYGQKIDLFMWNFSPSFSCFSRKYLWSTELVKTICETAVFSSSESFPNYMQSMVSL